jgi:hypothetical protein
LPEELKEHAKSTIYEIIDYAEGQAYANIVLAK